MKLGWVLRTLYSFFNHWYRRNKHDQSEKDTIDDSSALITSSSDSGSNQSQSVTSLVQAITSELEQADSYLIKHFTLSTTQDTIQNTFRDIDLPFSDAVKEKNKSTEQKSSTDPVLIAEYPAGEVELIKQEKHDHVLPVLERKEEFKKENLKLINEKPKNKKKTQDKKEKKTLNIQRDPRQATENVITANVDINFRVSDENFAMLTSHLEEQLGLNHSIILKNIDYSPLAMMPLTHELLILVLKHLIIHIFNQITDENVSYRDVLSKLQSGIKALFSGAEVIFTKFKKAEEIKSYMLIGCYVPILSHDDNTTDGTTNTDLLTRKSQTLVSFDHVSVILYLSNDPKDSINAAVVEFYMPHNINNPDVFCIQKMKLLELLLRLARDNTHLRKIALAKRPEWQSMYTKFLYTLFEAVPQLKYKKSIFCPKAFPYSALYSFEGLAMFYLMLKNFKPYADRVIYSKMQDDYIITTLQGHILPTDTLLGLIRTVDHYRDSVASNSPTLLLQTLHGSWLRNYSKYPAIMERKRKPWTEVTILYNFLPESLYQDLVLRMQNDQNFPISTFYFIY